MLGKNQILTLLSAAILAMVLFFGTKITSIQAKGDANRDKKTNTENTNENTAAAPAPLMWDAIENEYLSELSADQKVAYEALKKEGFEQQDVKKKIDGFDKLVLFWKNKNKHDVAGYYIEQIASIENKDTMFYQAGKAYRLAAEKSNDTDKKASLLAKAIANFKRALSINADNTPLKIDLAQVIVESGSENPMEGIQLLRDVVAKDSNQIDANLALGKFAIVSGQYDKAITRLERMKTVYPKNVDVLFVLAEAYKNIGKKAEAKETIKQCMNIVQDDSLKTVLAQYMNEI